LQSLQPRALKWHKRVPFKMVRAVSNLSFEADGYAAAQFQR
jgi:hypothetical protein